jgi:hypothetical protein
MIVFTVSKTVLCGDNAEIIFLVVGIGVLTLGPRCCRRR